MILVTGWYDDLGLTGTIYEPTESTPNYDGSPDFGDSYVWICDSFYQVESGGVTQELENGTVQLAFERPMKKGFRTYDEALSGARYHIKIQFQRLGLSDETVEFNIKDCSS